MSDKIKALKREAWIHNTMKKLGYTREQAESSYARIFSFCDSEVSSKTLDVKFEEFPRKNHEIVVGPYDRIIVTVKHPDFDMKAVTNIDVVGFSILPSHEDSCTPHQPMYLQTNFDIRPVLDKPVYNT